MKALRTPTLPLIAAALLVTSPSAETPSSTPENPVMTVTSPQETVAPLPASRKTPSLLPLPSVEMASSLPLNPVMTVTLGEGMVALLPAPSRHPILLHLPPAETAWPPSPSSVTRLPITSAPHPARSLPQSSVPLPAVMGCALPPRNAMIVTAETVMAAPPPVSSNVASAAMASSSRPSMKSVSLPYTILHSPTAAIPPPAAFSVLPVETPRSIPERNVMKASATPSPPSPPLPPVVPIAPSDVVETPSETSPNPAMTAIVSPSMAVPPFVPSKPSLLEERSPQLLPSEPSPLLPSTVLSMSACPTAPSSHSPQVVRSLQELFFLGRSSRSPQDTPLRETRDLRLCLL